MICTKKELREYLKADAIANNRDSIHRKPIIIGSEEIWSIIVTMRKLEYLSNVSGIKKYCLRPLFYHYYLKFKRKQVKLGFCIPYGFAGPGFSIAHIGCLTINHGVKVGKNCRIHEGVCIGATGGNSDAATIGDNVFIGSGAKIIGKVTIADDVAIGAGAVVVKDILEPGTTWGGIPLINLAITTRTQCFQKG